MRTFYFALGLFLLFIGLALASSYNLPVEDRWWGEVKSVTDQWEIESYFREGTNMTLNIMWALPVEYSDFSPLNGTVAITAPDNGEITFRVLFVLVTQYPVSWEEGLYPLQITEIELVSLDSDGLTVSNPPRQIGGIVKQDGVYKARILKEELWWLTVAPRSLILLKEEAEKRYPFTILLPIGVACWVSGALDLFYVARGSKGVERKRRQKKGALGR